MMQGDSYNLGIHILNNAGSPVTPDDILDVEITIGSITKSYLKAQLLFEEGVWMFPLTQAETQGFWPGPLKSQVRVRWTNGAIEGKPLFGIVVNEGISKEVL